MKRNRKAKILSTLGPSSSSLEIIEKLFLEGTDVFRLNFSHGSIEDHRKNLEKIRSLEKKYNYATCILADLQGPKLRIGIFKNKKEKLILGQKFKLDLINQPGDNTRVNFPHPEIYEIMTPNTNILIDDGKIKMQVIEQNKDSLILELLNNGTISNQKGVNIPDAVLPISSLTDKDKSDLSKALDMGVDWVALSFVQSAQNVEEFKKIVDGKSLIMAKIEKPSAVKNLKDILKFVDGIMIARGDLGVEMPPERVPAIQKNIIQQCRQEGKPVIVATQMLESMINNNSPTRAEASDVANAIYDGADAVMLSAESAIGHYPIESVIMMNKIIQSVETDSKNYSESIQMQNTHNKSSTDAITNAAYTISENAEAKAIVTFSVSGRTTLRMSRERAPVQVVGVSPSVKTARKLQIAWGVHSCHGEDAQNTREMVANACILLKKNDLAKIGDSIVITAGVPFGNAGSTNLLRIAKIIADKDLT
jgi:pyruvate kinase